MKRLQLLIFAILITLTCKAPGVDVETLIIDDAVKPFERVALAVGMVESSCNNTAYNKWEQAAGYFQIRPVRLRDYNKRTGHHYTMRDLYRFEVSREIFMYYAMSIGPTDMNKVIRDWNGSGPLTYTYLTKVKAELNKL